MPAQTNTQNYPLPLAPRGELVRVMGFSSGKTAELRLASMGITPGSVLQILEGGNGTLVVAVGHTRLALGAGIAHKIMVASAA